MFHLCFRGLIILCILAFLGNSVEAQTNENEQGSEPPEEILIFRTSPGKESVAEGLFRFQVSSFSPLLVVKVNGFAQMVTKDTDWAEYEVPYFLKKGKNLFKIFVQTKTGQREEEFVVTYEPPEQKSKSQPPLNGVVMIGQTHSDNIINVPESSSKTSAAKNDLLLSGAYAFEINEESAISLNAVLKFDRHQNRSLVAEEVLFRQYSTDYRHKNLLGLDFSSGLGQSVISLKDENPSNPYKAGEFSEDVDIEDPMVSQTPIEFCEETKEKTRVQKLFECPKCKKMLTKKTLMYYHECTKNDAPKAKRRPKKIVVKDIEETNTQEVKPEKVEITRQTNQIVEQGEKFLTSVSITGDAEKTPPSYEELRRERLQQRIQQRNVKIQQLFKSAI